MGQLAGAPPFLRDLAEDGWGGRKGCAGPDAEFKGKHHARYLPAVRSRIATLGCWKIIGTGALNMGIPFHSISIPITRRFSRPKMEPSGVELARYMRVT